ncbi:uncharacterized protein MELLADRAFT_71040 [Melampsora larici-populina 98AG31]|uniref:Uncharacterized protein n=1 Tax=Melampsora larici-populina (strain 98AG31 / pathotype 3-4-7) TaxID=747676 RepID=F4RBC4_MELLP|nr:uncharacterized protein MELLADRAFT_71040 [Melampsora larici-populina 98AG31]EGG10060.1 hypothetical protein MELLADRAFT_71040 [Melampsora larici-populina 98AG31]
MPSFSEEIAAQLTHHFDQQPLAADTQTVQSSSSLVAPLPSLKLPSLPLPNTYHNSNSFSKIGSGERPYSPFSSSASLYQKDIERGHDLENSLQPHSARSDFAEARQSNSSMRSSVDQTHGCSVSSPGSEFSHKSQNPLTNPKPRSNTRIQSKSKAPSAYSIGLIGVTFVQSLVVVAILAFACRTLQDSRSEISIVSAYLIIFIIAAALSFILVLDSIMSQDVIQLIALCAFNLFMTCYGAVLPVQLWKALQETNIPAMKKLQGWLQVVPCVMGASTLLMTILTISIHKEFGWDIYKQMGANMQLKRAGQYRAVFSILQKFNSFFFLGAMIQYAVLGQDVGWRAALTSITVMLVCTFIMVSAAIAISQEIRWPLWLSHLGSFCMLAYVSYLLAKVVPQPQFSAGHRTLRFFLIVSLLSLVCVMVVSEICAKTFGLGMRELGHRKWWRRNDNLKLEPFFFRNSFFHFNMMGLFKMDGLGVISCC